MSMVSRMANETAAQIDERVDFDSEAEADRVILAQLAAFKVATLSIRDEVRRITADAPSREMVYESVDQLIDRVNTIFGRHGLR